MGGLRDKLNRSNLTEVSFMIVNEREAMSRAMYWELKRRAPPGVPVYQQTPFQDDVWEALDGDKDDFLIYDRCGLLTFHIVLPYSFLHSVYVEAAIRATYLKNICNCTVNSTLSSNKLMNETTHLNVSQTTTVPTIQLDTDQPEEGDTAAGVTHHGSHHLRHPHHHPDPHHHHHQPVTPPTGHQNQTEDLPETSQNKTLHPVSHHHNHHPQHHHTHHHQHHHHHHQQQQPGNHSDPDGMEVDN